VNCGADNSSGDRRPCRDVDLPQAGTHDIGNDDTKTSLAVAVATPTDRRPIFILCAARSGSTLLRYALDAHPEVACPTELNVAEAFAQLARIFGLINGAQFASDPKAMELSPETIASCRSLAEATLGRCAVQSGKPRWADKSLVNALFADLISQIFPEAQYLCLFRDCADFIISAHAASPWGMSGYGLEPYIRETPGNTVFSAARYWADQTEAILTFSDAHAEQCYRIRYEDLVCEPEATLAQTYRFLGLQDDAIPSDEAIFDEKQRMRGPQDHKISFTSTFDPSSIGQGWKVPTEFIPPFLSTRIDELADRIGYSRLDGQLESAVLGRGRTVRVGARWADEKADVLRRAIDETLALLFDGADEFAGLSSQKLLVPEIGGCWTIDFASREVRNGGEVCGSTIVAEATALQAILDGTENPATAIRVGKIRVVGSADPADPMAAQRHRDAFVEELIKASRTRSRASALSTLLEV
jgi:protein-tyrosine sulfotransferase